MKREVKPGRRVASFVPAGRPPAPARGRVYRALSRLDAWLEAHPAFRLLAIAGAVITFAATAMAAVGVMIELRELDADREARQEERVDRNRQILFRRGADDAGRGAAFNYLVRNNALIGDIDLSCRRRGEWTGDECLVKPAFFAIDYTYNEVVRFAESEPEGEDLEVQNLNSVNFSQSRLEAFRVVDATLDLDLSHAQLDFASWLNARIEGSFVGITMTNSALEGSSLIGDFEGAQFTSTNISGSHFESTFRVRAGRNSPWACEPDHFGAPGRRDGVFLCMPKQAAPDLRGARFWADRPPSFSPNWLEHAGTDHRPVACRPPEARRPFQEDATEVFFLDDCEEITWEDAARLYPDRWDSSTQCLDAVDPRFLRADRTAPNQPCPLAADDEQP